MANPKQLFRGHLLRQHRDTLHKRTLQPPSLFKSNPREDPHHKHGPGRSHREWAITSAVQSGNINNASTNEHITIAEPEFERERDLSRELNSDSGVY